MESFLLGEPAAASKRRRISFSDFSHKKIGLDMRVRGIHTHLGAQSTCSSGFPSFPQIRKKIMHIVSA
jgi:hypothetical protein